MNEPIGRFGSESPSAPDDGVRNGVDRLVLTDDALVQLLGKVQQLAHLAFEQAAKPECRSSG